MSATVDVSGMICGRAKSMTTARAVKRRSVRLKVTGWGQVSSTTFGRDCQKQNDQLGSTMFATFQMTGLAFVAPLFF